MTSVPGFLTKTFEIFSTAEYGDCCGWGPSGDTIIIRKIEQFSKQILPKYFKHSNFQSFVRQLNMYDFHKTVQDPSHGEFQHQFFKQNQPELLVYIKRKANNRGTETLKKFSANKPSTSATPSSSLLTAPSSSSVHHNPPSASTVEATGNADDGFGLDVTFSPDTLTKLLPDDLVQETDSVFQELEQQKLMREEFEKRMEEKLSKVEGENQMLKRLFFESHQKNLVLQERMERVLKTLYSVFVGGQAGKALTGRMPSLLLTDYPNLSAQPLKAILDKDANEELNKTQNNKRGSTSSFRSNPNSSQSEIDGTAIDLGSFEKLPSIDFGTSPSSFSNNNNSSSLEQYLHVKNSFAGKELSRCSRIGNSSFDFAAASVAPPLKYLPSFDSTCFSTNDFMLGEDAATIKSTNGNEQYHSDRVTLLSEDAEPSVNNEGAGIYRDQDRKSDARWTRSASRKRSTNTRIKANQSDPNFIYDFPSNSSQNRVGKRDHFSENRISDVGPTSTQFELEAKTESGNIEKRRKLEHYQDESGKNLSSGPTYNHDNAPSTDLQFMDLLHRNQDSTLTRLDSLEQTIATLLEGIEYDDFPAGGTLEGSGDKNQIALNSDVQKTGEFSSSNLSETTDASKTNYAKLSAQAVSSASHLYNE